MFSRIRPRLNHATIVAYLALFVALGGTSVAALQIGSKQIVNNSIRSKDIRNNNVRGKDIRKGTIKSSDIGDDSLTGADIRESSLGPVPGATAAAFAGNAGALDGIDSTGFLRRGARGVAIAGLNVNTDGSLASWFNTVGGKPTVEHTSGDLNYDIVIPGASLDASNSVLSATPQTGTLAHTLINANYFVAAGNVGAIDVQTKTPTGDDEQGFHLLVFRASAGG